MYLPSEKKHIGKLLMFSTYEETITGKQIQKTVQMDRHKGKILFVTHRMSRFRFSASASKMYDFFSGQFPYNLFSFELHLKSEIKRLLRGKIFQSMQHSFTEKNVVLFPNLYFTYTSV